MLSIPTPPFTLVIVIRVESIQELLFNVSSYTSSPGAAVRDVDRMDKPLVAVVHVHRPLRHELEQLYHHAVAPHVPLSDAGCQQGEYEPHCRALYC